MITGSLPEIGQIRLSRKNLKTGLKNKVTAFLYDNITDLDRGEPRGSYSILATRGD